MIEPLTHREALAARVLADMVRMGVLEHEALAVALSSVLQSFDEPGLVEEHFTRILGGVRQLIGAPVNMRRVLELCTLAHRNVGKESLQ